MTPASNPAVTVRTWLLTAALSAGLWASPVFAQVCSPPDPPGAPKDLMNDLRKKVRKEAAANPKPESEPRRRNLPSLFGDAKDDCDVEAVSKASPVPCSREQQLAELINAYRLSAGQKPLAIDPKLQYVAQMKVRDLQYWQDPDQHLKSVEALPGEEVCSAHSWSSEGPWTSCCYVLRKPDAECMYRKPAELAGYKGKGYEIALGPNFNHVDRGDPAAALGRWKASPRHNIVIINGEHSWTDPVTGEKGHASFKDLEFTGMGIGIHKGYAVVWFGDGH